jgi:mxaD protein
MKKALFAALLAAAALAPIAASAGAVKISRDTTIDGAPATVWKLIGNYNAIDVWHPAVVNSTLTGTGTSEGSVRTLTLGDGGMLTEPLVSYSAEKMSYTYQITKSPLPIKNYTATVTLTPAPGGKTVMTWSGDFDADGKPDKEVADLMSGVYDAGLKKVAGIFKR